jgi:4-diphosphocytidyl-2-C-methyl-D-erythritol kinase
MIFFPNAKINIGLRIIGKRSDGYHNIETIFYPVGLSDALEYIISDNQDESDQLILTGINTGGTPENNLVIKSIRKLREIKPFPYLKVHLHKAIPVGAGLGGGSSDAACMLKVLNRHLSLGIDKQVIRSVALELGSDCPFFVDCVPSHASGRGEILTPVNQVLTGYYMVIANPGVGISTSEAYQNCVAEMPDESLVKCFELPVNEWKGRLVNDFEDFAFRKRPVIGELKDEFYRAGAIFSLMSGSGSSVYGIFSGKPKLPGKLTDYLIWEGFL